MKKKKDTKKKKTKDTRSGDTLRELMASKKLSIPSKDLSYMSFEKQKKKERKQKNGWGNRQHRGLDEGEWNNNNNKHDIRVGYFNRLVHSKQIKREKILDSIKNKPKDCTVENTQFNTQSMISYNIKIRIYLLIMFMLIVTAIILLIIYFMNPTLIITIANQTTEAVNKTVETLTPSQL